LSHKHLRRRGQPLPYWQGQFIEINSGELFDSSLVPVTDSHAGNIVVLSDRSIRFASQSVTSNNIPVTLRESIKERKSVVVLNIGRVPSVRVIIFLERIKRELNTVTLECFLGTLTVDLHHAPLDTLDHVSAELHASVGIIRLLALVQSKESLGDKIVPIIVCRDVQLVRVEAGVLVSGRDEVGDAVHASIIDYIDQIASIS
jgi:hypothetical protein